MHENRQKERIDRYNLSTTRSISGKRKLKKKASKSSRYTLRRNQPKLLEYARRSMKCVKNWKNDMQMVFFVGNSIDYLVILSIQERSNICSNGAS
jgi:hypothetical protein